jgi:hypothetical protein
MTPILAPSHHDGSRSRDRMGRRRATGLRVECQPAQPRSEVVVTDDLTALSARGQQVIERFAEDFGSFLDGWRRSIEAALDA